MWRLIAGIVVAQGVWAQSIVDPARLSSNLKKLAPDPSDQPLRCEVTPIKPALDYTFRFQTGYEIATPMAQYFGAGHGWAILTRVTPEGGNPVWLAARVRLPDVPLTTVVTDTFGGFLVGAGKYTVDWAMFDDEGRVCRHHWKIDARLTFAERHVQLAIPRGAVADMSGDLPRPSDAPAADSPPFRMTILLHAAPLSPRRMHIRVTDRILLLSTLSGLIQRVQPTGVRLAMFNFDKQRVLYSNSDFKQADIGAVSRALNRLELETVNVETLQNPRGSMDLLQSLIDSETTAQPSSDAVVFLGPAARYLEKLPPSALPSPIERMRFFYIQYRPFAAGRQAMLPDSISNAVSEMKGRIFQIYNPGQFAAAIHDIERLRVAQASRTAR